MSGINRSIAKQLSELGGRVYDMITVEKVGGRIAKDKRVLELIHEIQRLEEEMKHKEQEIESIKEDKHPPKTTDEEA
jgi:hypothetical protein